MNGWFGVKHMVENKSAEQVLCFGEGYISNYFKGIDNIKVVGSPKFDIAYRHRIFNQRYPIKKILITTFVFSPADINCRYSDNETYLKDILGVVKKFSDRNNCSINVTLRPHPSESPDFYLWLLRRLGYPEVELDSTKDYHAAALKADLYFGSYSTTLFETAAMGIPVIFYHPCNQILYPPFDGSDNKLPLAFTVEKLERVFNRVMIDKDYAYAFTKPAALNPYVSEMDGQATTRIIKEIAKAITVE